jgi:predicted alpha/beta superfamily hydrolase
MPTSRADGSSWKHYQPAAETPVPLVVKRRVLSPQLRNFRDVVVALPPGYDTGGTRYPVVYMQDGQNLFDPATSYAGDWRLTQTLADLAAEGTEAIVVGIANTGRHRLYEYSPFPDSKRGGGGGNRYLDFITETVKPMIDRDFRTQPERSGTSIAGSSMGGLISLYGLFRNADVFGAAGVLSPSLWFGRRALLDYLTSARSGRASRLYLDIGLDEPPGAVADVRTLREILSPENRPSRVELDYVEDDGGRHDEETWGRRVSRALPFLIGAA